MAFLVGEVSASITGDNTQFNRALDESYRHGQNWATQTGQNLNRIGGQMQTLGRTATMYVTAPILGIGAAAGKMHMDFEKSMSEVIGLVGVSKEQVGEWSEDLLKLGPALGKTPTELADALFFVTSAGLRGAEALDVLTYSAKGSAAGLGETKVVADLVTSAINAYGSENLDAAQATDILTAAVREGKAEAPELAASLGQVLPIASEMSVSFDQVGAAVAAMTRTGTDATTASMQLKNILMGLLKPSQQAETALSNMGTSSGELRAQIEDEGLLTVLMRLKDLTNEYGEELMAQVFPNIRSLLGVLDLMGSNMEENVGIFERMADTTGSLEHAFETASDTAKFKWDTAMAEAQSSLITLGEAVQKAAIPVLEEVTEIIGNLADWFRNLDEEQQQQIIRWAGIAAAIGPVLLITGTMAKSIGTLLTVFGGLGKSLIGIPGKISGIGAAATAAATPVVSYSNAMTAVGGTAVTTGGKLATLAAASGPILGLAAALGVC